MKELADIYFNGCLERATEYVQWVAANYGSEQVIKSGPPGVIFGTAAELLESVH